MGAVFHTEQTDAVQIANRFDSEVHLNSTLLHEVAHFSGAKHRLDRDLTGRFGNEA
ncbi:zincin-like metallopeptidase domain-containing protein [Allomesorhizobium camelthorni]|uniref:zincin-like metallopeptidase domain-containing protein n=1 Tax=Allomesorhizobium camelthorni TaxID=475069 RepID=UPI003CCE3488